MGRQTGIGIAHIFREIYNQRGNGAKGKLFMELQEFGGFACIHRAGDELQVTTRAHGQRRQSIGHLLKGVIYTLQFLFKYLARNCITRTHANAHAHAHDHAHDHAYGSADAHDHAYGRAYAQHALG